jgi:uncharacterized protein YndB with AHSA1/START domain
MAMQGTARRVEDGYVLTFERQLPHSVDKVWTALTDPGRISSWLGGEGSSIELRVGGRVHFPQHGVESNVVALDPPRMIEWGWTSPAHGWDGGTVRWELSEAGGGTYLTITHNMPELDPETDRRILKDMDIDPDEFPAVPRTLAGWHTLLDQLEADLAGEALPPEDHWRSVFEIYRDVEVRG